ncbi:hypothetical protein B0H15DRAFT_806722 [Mycena belliarum]|uniref:Uncharacterized protein n=1 Tax=Mycena belliarum TaxID=1033014 RepID=A0AAD6XLT8_9AGAR|nr:hypothetical protein B0H15DRAFT_806722 [Mycena belliae]
MAPGSGDEATTRRVDGGFESSNLHADPDAQRMSDSEGRGRTLKRSRSPVPARLTSRKSSAYSPHKTSAPNGEPDSESEEGMLDDADASAVEAPATPPSKRRRLSILSPSSDASHAHSFDTGLPSPPRSPGSPLHPTELNVDLLAPPKCDAPHPRTRAASPLRIQQPTPPTTPLKFGSAHADGDADAQPDAGADPLPDPFPDPDLPSLDLPALLDAAHATQDLIAHALREVEMLAGELANAN